MFIILFLKDYPSFLNIKVEESQGIWYGIELDVFKFNLKQKLLHLRKKKEKMMDLLRENAISLVRKHTEFFPDSQVFGLKAKEMFQKSVISYKI